MADLGYDIWSIPYHYKEFRTIPVGTILKQVVKVMKQIKLLVGRRMIHGDVRETNIMVNPKSGDITLIDFDLLYPVDTFYTRAHLGFYCHPPETLLYTHFKPLLQATKDGNQRAINTIFESADLSERIDKYVDHHSDFEITSADTLDRSISRNELIAQLKESLRFYATYLNPSWSKELLQKALRETLLPSFDSYGLAFSLLEFISHVYPSVTKRVQKDIFDTALRSRLRNGTRPYTNKQIRLIRTTLHELVFEVLEPMVNFQVKDRLMISDAFEKATEIVNKFNTSI
jgi:serine/threonine protein kinase